MGTGPGDLQMWFIMPDAFTDKTVALAARQFSRVLAFGGDASSANMTKQGRKPGSVHADAMDKVGSLTFMLDVKVVV